MLYQTVTFALLLCSAFLQTLSSGYMVYHLQRTNGPSSRQYPSSEVKGANSKRSSSRSLMNYLFGSDMVIPTEPTPYYYQEPTFSVVRYLDEMVDRQFRDFDDFFLDDWRPSRNMMMPFRFSTATSIDIDIKENPKEYVLRADVPGVRRQDIQLTVSQGILEISAERKTEEASGDGTYARQERSYGKSSRSLQLPDGIDEDRIKAQYQDGVISLTIPKKPNMEGKPKVKKIDIASTAPAKVGSTAAITDDIVAVNGVDMAAVASKDQVSTIQSPVATDGESNNGLMITEDDKLPTDGPAQDVTREPTLVHSSYA